MSTATSASPVAGVPGGHGTPRGRKATTTATPAPPVTVMSDPAAEAAIQAGLP
jgi:hypothetical protein